MEQTPLKQTKGSSSLFVSRSDEWDALLELQTDIKFKYNEVIHPKNTLIINVSPDYSSTVAMHLAHALSKDGDMLDVLPVDVPFPGEMPDKYQRAFREFLDYHHLNYDNFILVEAAVLTGGNYTWMIEMMEQQGIDRSHIITAALYQSELSTFTCDCAGVVFKGPMVEFYYERYNKYWD